MDLTLDYIYANLMYDLTVDDAVKLHGNIDYVSSHFADGETNKLVISQNQPKELQSFVNDYFEALKTEPNLTVETFYNRKAI